MKKLKRISVVLLTIILLFFGYVWLVNLNSQHMTYRQKILKAVYPAFMWLNKATGKRSTVMSNEINDSMQSSLYDLNVKMIDGSLLPLRSLKGKKILIVNTASDCGYTPQYDELQRLSVEYDSRLVVIGFPANDFKEQEKGDDATIAAFCKKNYGVTFPLASKSSVIPGPSQHPVFEWLTNSQKNGWSDQPPTWNFSKYLVDENGKLINYFDPGVSPMSEPITNAIKK